MRILLLADNKPGLYVSKYLSEENENIVGVCLHEKRYQNYGNEIIKYLNLPKEKIFEISDMKNENTYDFIKKADPDIILSIYWRYLLPEEIFSYPKYGCINYHAAMLPYNRGKNPNVWPIIENTPAGVTLHYIDKGIDTGEIIAQKEVEVEHIDTGESLYNKLNLAFEGLFSATWPKIRKNNIIPKKQLKGQGSFHTSKQFRELGEIDLNKKYKAIDLINLLRSKTFTDKPAAFYIKDGKRIFLRLYSSYE